MSASVNVKSRASNRTLASALIALLFGTLLAGCATVERAAEPIALPTQEQSAAADCLHWYAALDRHIDAAAVRDAESSAIPGFPYLRSNRFLASFRNDLATVAQIRAWLTHLHRLDLEARKHELSRLEARVLQRHLGSFGALSGQDAHDYATHRAAECGTILINIDIHEQSRLSQIRAAATVPDRYSIARRVLGVYPLSRYFVAAGVRHWEKGARELIATSSSDWAENSPRATNKAASKPTGSPARRYVLASGPQRDFATAAHGRNPSPRTTFPLDELGVPTLSESDKRRLLTQHAPEIVIDYTGTEAEDAEYDRIGRITVNAEGVAILSVGEPTIYGRIAFTRNRADTLIQLVYTVWFTQRPPRSSLDILSGHLDGVIVRLTLTPDGAPAVIDSIHPCGCYHMFFRTGRAHPKPRPPALGQLDEWRLMPGPVLPWRAGDRLRVYLQSASHYLRGAHFVSARSPSDKSAGTDPSTDPSGTRFRDIAMGLRPESELRSLPSTQGSKRTRRASLYGPDGIVAGTERLERFLLWPMGIVNPGAMRQWGHHATAFVGQRHFDEARLIEERFDIH